MPINSIPKTEIMQDINLYMEVARIAKSINSDNIIEYSKAYSEVKVFDEREKIIEYSKRNNDIDAALIYDFLKTSKYFTEKELKKIKGYLKTYKFATKNKTLFYGTFLPVILIVIFVAFVQLEEGNNTGAIFYFLVALSISFTMYNQMDKSKNKLYN